MILLNKFKRVQVFQLIDDELQFQFKNWKKDTPGKDSIPTWLERMEKHFELAKQAKAAGDQAKVMDEIRILTAIGAGAMTCNSTPSRNA